MPKLEGQGSGSLGWLDHMRSCFFKAVKLHEINLSDIESNDQPCFLLKIERIHKGDATENNKTKLLVTAGCKILFYNDTQTIYKSKGKHIRYQAQQECKTVIVSSYSEDP